MKFSLIAVTLLTSIPRAITFTISTQRARINQSIRLNALLDSNSNEFDYLLQEVTSNNDNSNTQTFSRRQIALTDSNDIRTTILASSFPMPTTDYRQNDEQLQQTQEEGEVAVDNDDPYSNILEGQIGKIQKFEEQKQTTTIENKLKSMDLQDIVLTLIIPSVLAFVSVRWIYNRVSVKVINNKDNILDTFAKEMLYHDGDFKEMELCIIDYKKKLLWTGPNKSDSMLKRYLELYAKKKTVSPQAIASLSYVFTLFKLSEEKAASILVSLCKQMGVDKISSAGKLLFLGSRIMKSKEGKDSLLPIKELIMSTYREEAVAATLVDVSQQ